MKGSALLIRANMFYSIASFWAKPYLASTNPNTDLGVVLRLSSDPNISSVRSTLSQTYSQIIGDLKQAIPLLPNNTIDNTPVSKTRPSKVAAYGLLARTYLSMGDYQNVFLYADSALKIYSTLLDYNKVTGTMSTSANLYNAETVLITQDQGGTGGASSNWFISNDLVNSYSSNDLRKSKFFLLQTTGGITGYRWVGDYTGGQAFTGIANDELYLMRAEASARLGNTAAAMADLNVLLVTRYVTGTYVNRTATDAGNALVQILAERRKELVHRAGLRWTDLRRLNTDSRFAVTLTRTVAGVTYTLPPNDARYTLRIPDYITANAPDIVQNP